MPTSLLHPRDEIVQMMQRIYRFGMTTTSGGNISILDDDGSVWITPASVDKGSLSTADVVRVNVDGSVTGPHQPSSEFPFHRAIYQACPAVKAVLHAHPSALVAFSIVRRIPDTRIIPLAHQICGSVGYAKYGLPGSTQLGDTIAQAFAAGKHGIVILENHGVVAAGASLQQAFERFETLDYCARLAIKAASVGPVNSLSDRQLTLADHRKHLLPEFTPAGHSSREREVRAQLCTMVRRAYQQQLMTSTEGTASARLQDGSFLITPYGVDRRQIEPADIVRITNGKREKGKVPSRAVLLHQAIYARHPSVNAVVLAQPPNAMAFAVTAAPLDTRVIPESYVILRGIPRVPFGLTYQDEAKVADTLGPHAPVVMVENDTVLTTGETLLQAYDRLEVTEFTAKAVISAQGIGGFVHMEQDKIKELEKTFF